MAKTLYFYSDINNPKTSDFIRNILNASRLPFIELRLGKDERIHNVKVGGVDVLTVVDDVIWKEFLPVDITDLLNVWNLTPEIIQESTDPPADPADVEDFVQFKGLILQLFNSYKPAFRDLLLK